MTKLDCAVNGKRGRKRRGWDAAAKHVSENVPRLMEPRKENRSKDSGVSATMNDDGEGWTDDEETIEKEVERINHLPLSRLRENISSRVPCSKLSSKDG